MNIIYNIHSRPFDGKVYCKATMKQVSNTVLLVGYIYIFFYYTVVIDPGQIFQVAGV